MNKSKKQRITVDEMREYANEFGVDDRKYTDNEIETMYNYTETRVNKKEARKSGINIKMAEEALKIIRIQLKNIRKKLDAPEGTLKEKEEWKLIDKQCKLSTLEADLYDWIIISKRSKSMNQIALNGGGVYTDNKAVNSNLCTGRKFALSGVCL